MDHEELLQIKNILETESRNGDYWYHRSQIAERELERVKKILVALINQMEASDIDLDIRTRAGI